MLRKILKRLQQPSLQVKLAKLEQSFSLQIHESKSKRTWLEAYRIRRIATIEQLQLEYTHTQSQRYRVATPRGINSYQLALTDLSLTLTTAPSSSKSSMAWLTLSSRPESTCCCSSLGSPSTLSASIWVGGWYVHVRVVVVIMTLCTSMYHAIALTCTLDHIKHKQ